MWEKLDLVAPCIILDGESNPWPFGLWEDTPLNWATPARAVCLFFFLFFYFFIFFIVIQLQLYAFSPHPSTPPQLNPPPSPFSTLPLGFVHVSFIVVPVIPSTHCPRPHPRPPPWLLLDCSQLQCLWLYFVCFFLLLLMFQIKVRSYGICPSLPGLFHLA